MDFFKTVFVLALFAASGSAQAPISWNSVVRTNLYFTSEYEPSYETGYEWVNGQYIKGCVEPKTSECLRDVLEDHAELYVALVLYSTNDTSSIDCMDYYQFYQRVTFCFDVHCDDFSDVCDTSRDSRLVKEGWSQEGWRERLEHCTFVIFCHVYEFALAVWAGLVAFSLILVVPSILIVKSKNPAYVDRKIVLFGLLSCLFVVLGPIIYIIFICVKARNTQQTVVAIKV